MPIWTKKDPIVSIKEVHKSFGNLRVLKGVSMDVMKGEVICIIGPSGSGKSSLLNILSLIDKPSSGVIKIDNNNINY